MSARKIAIFTIAEIRLHIWHEPGEGYLGILSDREPEPTDPAFSSPLAATWHYLGGAVASRASVRWIDASHAPRTP